MNRQRSIGLAHSAIPRAVARASSSSTASITQRNSASLRSSVPATTRRPASSATSVHKVASWNSFGASSSVVRRSSVSSRSYRPSSFAPDQQQRHADEALPRQLQRHPPRGQHDRQDQRAEDRENVGHEQRAPEQCVPPQAHGRAARRCGRASTQRVPTRAAAQPERRSPRQLRLCSLPRLNTHSVSGLRAMPSPYDGHANSNRCRDSVIVPPAIGSIMHLIRLKSQAHPRNRFAAGRGRRRLRALTSPSRRERRCCGDPWPPHPAATVRRRRVRGSTNVRRRRARHASQAPLGTHRRRA